MAELPSGTVTFLFTDIQGSTDLAQRYPDQLPALLDRHHAILHAAIEANHGHVFQIIGDSFHVAFHTVLDGLNAAVMAQRLLHQEKWSPAPIKVRMGLNTGEAQSSGVDNVSGGYSGYSTLARVARVMSVAHGGQILLANSTAELVRSHLPAGISVRNMGEHRLKGLTNLENLWQVVAPDLQIDFPPLSTLNVTPNNLPTQLTSFIGREMMKADLKTELNEHRLVTLIGSGGTGKTRLSLQVAADLLADFKHGVWFIELAPLSDPDFIPQTILSVLGLGQPTGQPPLDLLSDYLRDKRALIVLDNCEHLVAACASIADTLLKAAPNLKILASSREALGIKGELSFPVVSLSLPDLKHLPAIDQLSEFEAVRLFIDRAQLVSLNFAVNAKNAPFIAQICYRLDGIPLAIELAAARVKMLSVDQISTRLDDRFRLLTGGSRTALPRQQTLRALIDWSYDILPDTERLLLQRLSVFAGGWTLEAAEAVCANVGRDVISSSAGQDNILPYAVLDILSQLVNKSLVVLAEESIGGSTRYRLLETIRQYARDRLFEAGQGDQVRNAQLDWFTRFALEADQKLRTGERLIWIDHLENDHANLQAALAWSLEQKTDNALRIVGALASFWLDRGYVVEGRHWTEQALALEADTPVDQASAKQRALRAHAVQGLAFMDIGLGDFVNAHTELMNSIQLWRELGEKRNLAFCLGLLAYLMLFMGNGAAAQATSEESVALARASGDRWMLGTALGIQGTIVFQSTSDLPKARALIQEAVAIHRGLGAVWDAARSLMDLGLYASYEGDFSQARTLLEESVRLFREDGNRTFGNNAQAYLADVLRTQGEFQEAAELYQKTLASAQEVKNLQDIASCLQGLGFVAGQLADQRQAQLKTAIHLVAAAEVIRQSLGTQEPPAMRAAHEQQIAQLQGQLPKETLQAAWADGQALALDEVIKVALSMDFI